MCKLELIQPTVQNVAEAISAALGVETEIVNDKLVVIAGTGKYHRRIGENMAFGFLYARVIRTGKTIFVENPAEDPTYDPSSLKGTTDEMADLCTPIIMGGKAIGAISFSVFDQRKKERLLKNKDELSLFLKRMAELLTAKIAAKEAMDELVVASSETTTILEAVHEGILAVNSNGVVTHCNLPAAKLLNISRENIIGCSLGHLWPGAPALEVLKSGKGYTEKEEIYHKKNKLMHFIVTVRIIPGPDKLAGLVISFRDIAEAHRLVYNMSQPHVQYTFDDIISASPLMETLKSKATQIAKGSSTVLITGESGTGKEMFARAIHDASPRKNRPFITVNCGAIPESLLESELFGYKGGAFTGAKKEGKTGKFEMANGGTIFLDEIGDMPLHLQVKLLHVLQSKRIERIGDTKSFAVDVRVIAATNKNLEAMIKSNEFREDLFYRLNVIPLHLLSLKDRKEDIPLLMQHFLAKYSSLMKKEIKAYENEVTKAFQKFDWPGNVRELENAVEYAVNMSSVDFIAMEHLPPKIAISYNQSGDDAQTLKQRVKEFEKQFLAEQLRQWEASPENKDKLAEKLGVCRATLYKKLSEYNLI